MKLPLAKDNRGIAHLELIVLVVVVALIGGAGYLVYSKNKDNGGTNSSLSDAVKEAAKNCDLDDKDLCKFFASWTDTEKMRMISTSTADGETTTMTFEKDGDKTYLKSEGGMSYEVITIGDTTYTKAPNGTWWKQTHKANDQDSPVGDIDIDFEEPSSSDEAEATRYEKLGKEACGNLSCFKYQVITPGSDGTEYLWFDDKDYLVRKTRTEYEGTVSEVTFEYDNISISEPSPVRELGENQYLMPGEDEPVTLPSDAAMEEIMNSYGL